MPFWKKIDKKLDNDKKTPIISNESRKRRFLKHYCWSHGAGNHTSADCRNKKSGHKDDATLERRKGGSDAYCKAALQAKTESSE